MLPRNFLTVRKAVGPPPLEKANGRLIRSYSAVWFDLSFPHLLRRDAGMIANSPGNFNVEVRVEPNRFFRSLLDKPKDQGQVLATRLDRFNLMARLTVFQ